MNDRKLPVTDSIEELALFWDTHDVTDFLDELEEVTEPVFGLRPEEIDELVIAQADDDSAWEGPTKVVRDQEQK